MKNNIKTVDKNKEKVDVKDTIHIIFNISSYKNPFFIEYLRTKNAKIIGTKDINKNILDQKFLGNYKKKIDMSKYIISNQYGSQKTFGFLEHLLDNLHLSRLLFLLRVKYFFGQGKKSHLSTRNQS